MNPSSALKDKVVFIQGAGRYPGPLLARAFAAQGAVVAACDLSPSLLNPLEKAATAMGGKIQGYVGDTSRGMPARALLDEVAGDLGPVEILINNPRIAPYSTILKTDEWDWHHTIEANLNGPFLLMHLVGRQLTEQSRSGVIINLIDSLTPRLSSPGRAAYAASQMGLLAMTRAAIQEFMAYNILVYGVCLEEALDNSSAAKTPVPCRWTGEITPQEPALQGFLSLEELILRLCCPTTPISPIQGQVFTGSTGLPQE